MSQPDVWLRGPVDGVPVPLQPAAHALLQALEEVDRAVAALPPDALWRRPGQAASPGFHLKHLIGATDRLLTYARDERLSDAQREWLRLEPRDGEPATTSAAELAGRFRAVVEAGLDQYRKTPPEALTNPLGIGRARLPTTVLGCLFHAGEHAARHAGQLLTTVKALAGS